jgi:hypothetical protein
MCRGDIHDYVITRTKFILFAFILLSFSSGVLIHSAMAADLQVNFGGLPADRLPVVPTNPQDKITTDAVRSSLTTTDIQTPTGMPLPSGTASVGAEATSSNDKQVLNIPISYSIGERTIIATTVPFAIIEYKTPSGDSEKNSSIGDVSVTLKQRFGDENAAEYQALLTTKFATGDKEKGLGTGAYEFGFTGKIIKRIDIHRITGMMNYTFSPGSPTIAGQEIKYGDKWTFMAAYDINIAKLLRIWLSTRLVASIIQETSINGIPQGDKLSTVDLSPEIKYFFSKDRAVSLGVNIPISTQYNVTNAESRDASVSIGFFSLF